jgi:hypothetical protein
MEFLQVIQASNETKCFRKKEQLQIKSNTLRMTPVPNHTSHAAFRLSSSTIIQGIDLKRLGKLLTCEGD